MLEERAYLARLEAAGPDELAQMLVRPSVEEERVLRAHLGNERYQRMHGMALRRDSMRALRKPSGNVVVIHGIMGGELTAFSGLGGEHIWAKFLRLAAGAIERLRLDDSGRNEYNVAYQVRATGIMKRHYGELLLSLGEGWRVEAFWFDWRKDLNLAAAELEAHLTKWFKADDPVHIVAHSMGGLVARTFIKNYPNRWASMWDKPGEGKSGGRLLMLGTPNHGSFVIPQIVTGLEGMVRKLALLDLRHNRRELLEIVNSFVGSYQMLPSHLVLPDMEKLYQSSTYGDANISQAHLDNARRSHERLHDVVDKERMIYVAGFDQPTYDSVDVARLGEKAAYRVTLDGDGRVPHELGRLDGVPTYYVEEGHGDLPANRQILETLNELLEAGETDKLPEKLPRKRARMSAAEARRQMEEAEEDEAKRLHAHLYRTRALRSTPEPPGYVSTEERIAEEILTSGFLTTMSDEAPRVVNTKIDFPAPRIEIALVHGGIEETGILDSTGLLVDTIAVGHYKGVKPASAELALDKAITASLHSDGKPPESGGLLAQLSERGTIRGHLGQPFFLPDPRVTAESPGVARIIAIAGMGDPGRFGSPELTVMVRELVWALGRMGKRHLLTVLIGSGSGNLEVEDAIFAWIRGLKAALTGTVEEEGARLERVTFTEFDPRRVLEIDKAILRNQQRLQEAPAQIDRMVIEYQPLDGEQTEALEQKAEVFEREERKRQYQRRRESRPAPVRITVGLVGNTYRFGAITDDASIPEREIPLDPSLVHEANQELVAEGDPSLQKERGSFLEKLLIPRDLRPRLASDSPLVMLLDATTARIHWEMVAQPELLPPTVDEGAGVENSSIDAFYLGTCRGFTRQLRTIFAPPPEPPPPARRLLRVLVVADPAKDAHLPGAEEEGLEVADLFESFNSLFPESESRVEVVRLFGPREATRTTVLRHLTLRSYDVLHFSGHCVFDKQNPASSGWLFSDGQRLSAHELNRIDRIPNFVFSNACESGVTPDRSELRDDRLAPSFAEAFFQRGVVNFVCTAWPVDDLAARTFAQNLYGHLLGISVQRNSGATGYAPLDGGSHPMYKAMREARLETAKTFNGLRTWGAYQHYGNPNFQFFASSSATSERGRSREQKDSSVRESANAEATAPSEPQKASKEGTRKKRSSRARRRP